MLKLLLAAAIAAVSISAAPPPAPPPSAPAADASPYFVNLGLVREIACADGDLLRSGSGSYIDADRVLTAYHVVAHGACVMDGQPVQILYADAALDVAVMTTPIRSHWRMPIRCAPPAEGEEYFAFGFPYAEAFVVERLTGTGNIQHGRSFDRMGVFRGHVLPGMSGGPVVDRDGQLVGIVNAANERGAVLSRLTKDLWLCPGTASAR